MLSCINSKLLFIIFTSRYLCDYNVYIISKVSSNNVQLFILFSKPKFQYKIKNVYTFNEYTI